VRLYLDQMLRSELAEVLRLQGHDVLRAAEAGQTRADDEEILNRVCREGRILVTLDEHFGDWAILPLAAHPGVIRLKIHPPTVENLQGALLPLLEARTEEDFRNHLVIATTRRQRWIKTAR
jgi:predicted nuclease of predicted toxin-antitoxin system